MNLSFSGQLFPKNHVLMLELEIATHYALKFTIYHLQKYIVLTSFYDNDKKKNTQGEPFPTLHYRQS